MVQQISLAHMPPELSLFVALYSNVSNAPFLKQQLLAGNSAFEYAFIDASVIMSTRHVLAAAFRAMNDYLNDRLKSHNVHSEIVFSLSPNNNIGEAFRRFGVGDQTSNLLVLKVSTSPDVTLESVRGHLAANIEGQEGTFDDSALRQGADFARIRKIYKVGTTFEPKINGTSSHGDDTEDHGPSTVTKHLETQILGLMALRGAT